MDMNVWLPLILQGVGGALIGPLLSGRKFGIVTRVLFGIIGGVAVGRALDYLGLMQMISGWVGGGTAGMIVSNLLAGGVGGAVIAAIAGIAAGRR